MSFSLGLFGAAKSATRCQTVNHAVQNMFCERLKNPGTLVHSLKVAFSERCFERIQIVGSLCDNDIDIDLGQFAETGFCACSY